MHYYRRNPGNYARDAGHLSALEHGVYVLLMDWYAVNETPISLEKAIKISRGNPSETQSVLSEFFVEADGGWTHPEVAEQIESFHAKAAVNAKNGASGGRPKGSKTQSVSNRKAAGEPSVSLTKEPITKKRKATPVVPTGDESSAAPKVNKRGTNLETWLASLAEGEKAIKPDAAVFTYANNAGIPPMFVRIAWFAFRSYHLAKPEKRQVSWPAAFRNYVAENYMRLWRCEANGTYALTDKGVQQQRAMEGAANGEA